MKPQTTIVLIALTVVTMIFSSKPFSKNSCNCDKSVTEKTIKSKEYNRLPKFDDKLKDKGFYHLSAEDNKTLWYRDVENPEKTKFTSLWNDYAPNNYHASHLDFIKYYQDRQDIELAFQFGPNNDLWAYHIFVVKKVDCCYLITRSYFRHARFTGKQYAVLDNPQLDSLFSVIDEQKVSPVDTIATFDYCGYFSDNRNKRSFYINFVKDQVWVSDKQDTTSKYMEARPEIKKLYDFVDNKIKWTKTYSL